MRSTLNVSLNKITQDQGIYPRFNTDYVRVYLFTELMEIGEKFPPVKVVRNGDFYVLLDGNHRLEASKRLCKEKIAADVFDIPERLWRLAAARFNGKSSMPLKGDELKRVIENAWTIDKIRDTYEIAKELGCSDRYVRKVLKPIRDQERKELENKIRRMGDKGVSKKEAADKLDLSRATLYRIEKKSTNSQNETAPMFQNGTVPKRASLAPLEFPAGDRNNKREGECGEIPVSSQTENATNAILSQNGGVQLMNAGNNGDGFNSETLPQQPDNEKMKAENIAVEAEPETAGNSVDEDTDEPFPEGALEDPDYPNCIDWEPGQKETHRAFDMIYENWSIDRIVRKLDVSEKWVRNTALALLAIYHYGREKYTVEEIAEKFKMDRVRVEYIVWLNTHFTALPPDRKTLAIWLDKYSPNYQDSEYLELMRREKIYLKCAEEGEKPPWEYQEGMPEPFSEVPREIADKFYNTVDFVSQVAELVSLGLFQEESVEKDLLSKFNLLLIAMNKLRDNMQNKDYSTRCSEDAMRLKAYNYIHKGDYREAIA